MSTLKALLFLAQALIVLAQGSTPSCAPTDTLECFMTESQFTVLGTVLSTNLNTPGTTATQSNYNATVRVDCVFASFSDPISSIVRGGQTYNVMRWGKPQVACGSGNLGATATVNETKIFFFYIASRIVDNENPVLGVFDLCTGGYLPTNQSLQDVSNVLNDNPANKLLTGNNCTLPPSTSTGKEKPTDPLNSDFRLGPVFTSILLLVLVCWV